MNRSAIILGVGSSILAAIFTALFGIFIVLDNKLIYFLVCLLLAFWVVVMVVSLRELIDQNRKVFINCAIAFSIMYATLVSLVYYTQLAFVLKRALNPEMLSLISDAPGTAFFFIDMLGYVFLCLATLFIALAIRGYTPLRVLLWIHSLILVPTFLLPFLPVSFSTSEASGQVSGPLILVIWCVIFIPICLLLANYFLQQKDS